MLEWSNLGGQLNQPSLALQREELRFRDAQKITDIFGRAMFINSCLLALCSTAESRNPSITYRS